MQLDENGETAAQPDCGVGAADCLVGNLSGRVSAMLTENAAPGVAWPASALDGERCHCKVLIACMWQSLRLVCRTATPPSLARMTITQPLLGERLATFHREAVYGKEIPSSRIHIAR
jgi:hypothetical protein